MSKIGPVPISTEFPTVQTGKKSHITLFMQSGGLHLGSIYTTPCTYETPQTVFTENDLTDKQLKKLRECQGQG